MRSLRRSVSSTLALTALVGAAILALLIGAPQLRAQAGGPAAAQAPSTTSAETAPEVQAAAASPAATTPTARSRTPRRGRSRSRATKARAARQRASRARGQTAQEQAADEAGSDSVSIGHANRGRLVRGHHLEASDNVAPRGNGHHFGTDELVSLIERAAAAVSAAHPGSRLSVGSLSRERGGPISPHRSHRSGRDVDLGFYVTNADGEVASSPHFVSFGRDGTSRERADLRFDDARNWALISALLMDSDVPVQFIFVSTPLRQRLREQAIREHASAEVLDRLDRVVDQPSRTSPHRDHFHVRIYCPLNDVPRCLDEPPLHPWVGARALHAPVRRRGRSSSHATAHARPSRPRTAASHARPQRARSGAAHVSRPRAQRSRTPRAAVPGR